MSLNRRRDVHSRVQQTFVSSQRSQSMLSFRIFRIAMFTYSKGQSCVPGQPDPSSLCTSEIQTETLLKSRITLIPNPSLKRSANGRPPGLGWRKCTAYPQPGPGGLPLAPALSSIVIAPSKARRLLPGESSGRVRVGRPPVSRVGPLAERGNPRTGWGKRTQTIL